MKTPIYYNIILNMAIVVISVSFDSDFSRYWKYFFFLHSQQCVTISSMKVKTKLMWMSKMTPDDGKLIFLCELLTHWFEQ